MARKLFGAAKAAHEKKLAKRKRRTHRKKGSKTMARKRRRGGSRRSHRRGGRRRGSSGMFALSKRDTTIAAATALGYGLLQAKAESSKADEMTWFKEAPVITPLARAGTYSLAALAAYKFGRVKVAKPIGLGLGLVFLLQLGRRNFELYTDADKNSIMAGDDEGATTNYLAGGGDDAEVGVELVDANGEVVAFDSAA